MKQMLKTLVINDNITISDIPSVLCEHKEEKQLASSLENIPKICYREDRKEYFITVPKRLSKTGKRYPVYGKSEEEVVENYKIEVALLGGKMVIGEKKEYLH